MTKIFKENLSPEEMTDIRINYLNDNLAYDKYPEDLIEY